MIRLRYAHHRIFQYIVILLNNLLNWAKLKVKPNGEGGIRTLECLATLYAFQAYAINRTMRPLQKIYETNFYYPVFFKSDHHSLFFFSLFCSVFRIIISTLRFFSRPTFVLFEAIGFVSPKPFGFSLVDFIPFFTK